MTSKAPVDLCDCGMAHAVDIIGDRWSLLILRESLYGVSRFDDIQADIGIPKSVLSQRLRRLVDLGILEKIPYQEPGRRKRYGYQPSEAGRAFALPLLAIMQWGDAHIRRTTSQLTLYDTDSGRPVTVGYVRDDGQAVPTDKLAFKVPETSRKRET